MMTLHESACVRADEITTLEFVEYAASRRAEYRARPNRWRLRRAQMAELMLADAIGDDATARGIAKVYFKWRLVTRPVQGCRPGLRPRCARRARARRTRRTAKKSAADPDGEGGEGDRVDSFPIGGPL